MDIEYLLLLQNFRNEIGAFLSPFMLWITKFSVSFFPLALIFMIYWAFDRKAGKRMIGGFSLASFMNGFLKLTFCVYRPWIRDTRILPFGDSKITATGYSFPSGHSTAATSRFGSIAIWTGKKYKIVTTVMIAMFLLTMFSRNFLGVHTPQDVIVGCLSTLCVLFLDYAIENWSDKAPDKRDIIIMISGIAIVTAAYIYYKYKSFPLDYNAEGKLIVDPKKMIPDSFVGIGSCLAYVVCRYFERRGYDFESELNWKERFVIGIFALIPAMWWNNHIYNICSAFNLKLLGKFLYLSGLIFYVMILVPSLMKKIAQSKILDKIYTKLRT